MKNLMIGMSLGAVSGMALTAYAMSNPSTKKNADKMMNNAMTSASNAMDNLSKKMK